MKKFYAVITFVLWLAIVSTGCHPGQPVSPGETPVKPKPQASSTENDKISRAETLRLEANGLMKRNKPEEALKKVNESLNINLTDSALYLKTEIQKALGQGREAEKELEKSLENEEFMPLSIKVITRVILASLYTDPEYTKEEEAAREKKAMKMVDEILSLDPELKSISKSELSLTCQTIGIFLADQNRYEEALKYFEQRRSFDLKNSEATYDFGYCLLMLDRKEEAKKVMKEWLQSNPEISTADDHIKMMYAYMATGDYDKSLEYANKAIKMDEEQNGNSGYRYDRALLYKAKGNKEAARKDLLKTIEDDPEGYENRAAAEKLLKTL